MYKLRSLFRPDASITRSLMSFQSAWSFWEDEPQAFRSIYTGNFCRRRSAEKRVGAALKEPDFFCRCEVHWQVWWRWWGSLLHFNESTVDVIHGERWDQLKSCWEAGALHVSVDLLFAKLGSDVLDEEDVYLPVTDGRYLLKLENSPDHTGHNCFDVREGKCPWYFVRASRSEAISLLVCWTSEINMNYRWARRRTFRSHFRWKKWNSVSGMFLLLMCIYRTRDVTRVVIMTWDSIRNLSEPAIISEMSYPLPTVQASLCKDAQDL